LAHEQLLPLSIPSKTREKSETPLSVPTKTKQSISREPRKHVVRDSYTDVGSKKRAREETSVDVYQLGGDRKLPSIGERVNIMWPV
jgi:hypothetical protein